MSQSAANPPAIFCDTDALIQLCLSGKKAFQILRALGRDYGIRTVVVPEVETELLSNRKFGDRVKVPFRRALANKVLSVYDYDAPARIVPALASIVGNNPGATASVRTRATNLNLYIHRGEAYTHAAAEAVGAPVLSNDFSAIRTREQVGHPCLVTVLQAFDVLVFGLQTGLVSLADCEGFRSELERVDSVPRAFSRVSFEKGLTAFAARLIDAGCAAVCAESHPRRRFEHPIRIVKL